MVNSLRGKRLPTAIVLALMSCVPTGHATMSDARPNAAVTVSASSVGRYMVTFPEVGLQYYRGDVANLEATAPEAVPGAPSRRKLDSHSPASVSYLAWLSEQRSRHIADIEALLGRPLVIPHTYGVGRNGISVELDVDEANRLLALDGIISVEPVETAELQTFRAPTFVGAASLWDGSNVPADAAATRGEGMRIGVIDSGINLSHPSFANDPACGFSAANPKLVAKDCLVSAAGVCTGLTPAASTGHGVHTASTAAGNTLDAAATPAPVLVAGEQLSGVAPCASISTYKVCTAAGCSNDAIAASIESVVRDQVDVANYSIAITCGVGEGAWTAVNRRFLDAVAADVFVAAAAGNTRDACVSPFGRVSNLGPWLMTVAATSQDRAQTPQFQVSGPGTPPVELLHMPAIASTTTIIPNTLDATNLPMRASAANVTGCTASGAFPRSFFNGGVAVVRRGVCPFTEKVNNAQAAGAVMVVITNSEPVAITGIATVGTTLPSFAIPDQPTGDALLAFIMAHPGTTPDPDVVFAQGFETPPAFDGTTGNYVRATMNARQGDVLAGFSLRGPTFGNFANLSKPDISAPGITIFAAGRVEDGNYYVESGTSMASPVVAGSAALVRKLRPTWTVSEVKSALQTTAVSVGYREDGVTAWDPDDVGSGRVDLTRAAKAGLTLDETPANYLAANPDGGTLLMKNLNLPSMRNVACGSPCTWSRVVKNQLATTGNWQATASAPTGYALTVSPATFTLAAGASQALVITATPPAGSQPDLVFGDVVLTESGDLSPAQRLTVAVKKYVDPSPVGALDAAQAAIDYRRGHVPVVIKPAPSR